MFSLSECNPLLILHLEMTAGITDIGAFVIMFVAVISVFWSVNGIYPQPLAWKHLVLPLCCYTVLAIMPVVYNYMTRSLFASWLPLGINVIPVIIILLL